MDFDEYSINFLVEKLKEFSHKIKQNGELMGCSEEAINFVFEKLKVFFLMIKKRGENMDFEKSKKLLEEKILGEAWVQVLGPFLPYVYKAIRCETNEDLLNDLFQLLPVSLHVAFEDKLHRFQNWFNQVFPADQKRTQQMRHWLKVVLLMVGVLAVLILVSKMRWNDEISGMKSAAGMMMSVFEDDLKAYFINLFN